MQRRYDPNRRALVYVEKAATREFWDSRWETEDAKLRRLLSAPPRSYVTWTTSRCLRPGSGRILEGGCGRAQHVAALERAGYRCTGLDSAPRTVEAIRRVAPHLDVVEGDVFDLPFDDDSFVGYWSIGVIEHFWGGYDSIISEAARVLRSGGFFFLVYPYMSLARRTRARLGGYEVHRNGEPDGFYQFALDHGSVRRHAEAAGFELVSSTPRGGLIGLEEETLVEGLEALLRSSSAGARALRAIGNAGLAPVFGHTVIDVYRRG